MRVRGEGVVVYVCLVSSRRRRGVFLLIWYPGRGIIETVRLSRGEGVG